MYTMIIKATDGKHLKHYDSLTQAKYEAREEVKWESTLKVVILDDDLNVIFDEIGDFA